MAEQSDAHRVLAWVRQHNPEGRFYLLAIPAAGAPVIRFSADEPDDALNKTSGLSESHNVYFGPARHKGPNVGTKESACPTTLLWVDHDGPNADPASWWPRPHAAWQTSPGHVQALWLVDGKLEKGHTERLCKSLAVKLGADISGWDIGQVLRLPDTLNLKYTPPWLVTLLWLEPTRPALPVDVFEEGGEAEAGKDEIPDALDREHAYRILVRYGVPWEVVSSSFEQEQQDRSAALWRLEAALVERGAGIADVFRACFFSANNKFENTERLWEEARRAVAKIPRRQRAAWTLHELSELTSVEDRLEWIVRPFLYRDAVGTVVGEPSARKSWNALHFAVAVACPEADNYLGRPVERHGPVIYFDLDDQRPRRLKRRVSNILAYYRGGLSQQQKLDIPLFWVNGGFDFNKDGWRDALIASIDEVANKTGQLPGVIIIDTLHRAGFSPKDFGAGAQVLLDGLATLAVERNIAFLIVHHTAKSARSNPNLNVRNAPWGLTFTGASLDPTWLLTRKARADDGRLRVEMQVWSKEGPEGEPEILVYGTDVNRFEVETEEAGVEDKVLALLGMADGGNLTQSDLAKELDMHPTTLARRLERLRSKKAISITSRDGKKIIALLEPTF